MKRGRAELSSKFKPRLLFDQQQQFESNDDDEYNLLTSSTTTTTTTNTTKCTNNTTTTTTRHHIKRKSFNTNNNTNNINQQQQLYISEYDDDGKENNHHHHFSYSPMEKKVKTSSHSILLQSPPSAGSTTNRHRTTNVTLNHTPTRVLDFSDRLLSSLDDDEDCETFMTTPPTQTTGGGSSRTSGSGYFSSTNEDGGDGDHGLILTPPSSTLSSRTCSRRVSLTPPHGIDSIRRNLDFSSFGGNSGNVGGVNDNDSVLHHTLLSPMFNCQFSISTPKSASKMVAVSAAASNSQQTTKCNSASKKNRPTNILLPKSSSSSRDSTGGNGNGSGLGLASFNNEEDDDLTTPLVSPLLLASMDEIFGMEATRREVEEAAAQSNAFKGFSESSRRLAKDLELPINDNTNSNGTTNSDEEYSPIINSNVELRLQTILHPKISGCNSITSSTLLEALNSDQLRDQITIVDCRFNHEFVGGHIQGATNVWTPDMLIEKFFNSTPNSTTTGSSYDNATTTTTTLNQQQRIIIFHCEYSQARAPKMYRFMREYDRKINEYPFLSFPDIYVLEGGYKAFWEENESNKSYCEPMNYVAMDDTQFVEECKVSYQACKNAWKKTKSKRGSFL